VDEGKETAAFKKRKEDTKKSGNKLASPAKKPKTEDLKLALSSKFTSALVTHCHMGQAKVENMFDSIYNEATIKEENRWDWRRAVDHSIN
jgi:hypothetical protein